MLIILLVLELILFTAWQQLYRAWLLRHDLYQASTRQPSRKADEESHHNTKDKAPKNSEDKVGQPHLNGIRSMTDNVGQKSGNVHFGMTYRFYPVMGGFTVDMCRIDSKWP